MLKRFSWAGILVLLLLAAACSTDDENDKEGNMPETEEDVEESTGAQQESKEDIQPVYAEVDEGPAVLTDPVPLDEFTPETTPSHAEVSYDMDLRMEEEGTFHLEANITAENQSDDKWEHLVFYMIPNAFTEANKPDKMEDIAELDMETVQVDGSEVPYSLDGDTLAIELENPLANGERAEADITYTFTVPEKGIRFSEYEGDYFLAQFYPMLATYQEGWNKEEYNATGESYHTDFSDFSVTYDIPEGYTVFSSSDEENAEESSEGNLEVENIKEFYMAIMETDGLDVQSEDVDGTEVRVISDDGNISADRYMETAMDSLRFLEENIGAYPHDQLDVIVTASDEGGMEYPGIVTVLDSIQDVSEVVAHEITHQWFYGMVSNDAFHDPWVDEGVTQFVTYLYLMDAYDEVTYDETMEQFEFFMEDESNPIQPANLSLDAYDNGDEGWTYSLSVYTQTSYQFLKLFDDHGGTEEALQFLHDYFETYQYEEVDSEELLNYLISYLQIEDPSVFDDWLEVEMAEE